MTSIRAIRDPHPGASWVNITSDQDSDKEVEPVVASAADIPLPASPAASVVNFTANSAAQSHQSTVIEATKQHYSEPELIMPAIHEEPAVPTRRRSQRRNDTKSSVAASPPMSDADEKPRRINKRTRRDVPKAKDDSKQLDAADYMHFMWRIVSPIVTLVLGVLSLAFTIVKPILTIVLAFWLLSYLARYALRSTMTQSMSPICNIPGVSNFIPFCSTMKAAGPVEFDQLMTVQSAFEDVLASSAVGQNLPLDMKRSEASIRDLRVVVQYSQLPSRNELGFELTGFIDTARQAAGDLTKFNSRIGRAVDQVLSTNRWTLSVLDGAVEKQNSQGSVERFLANTVFSPFQNAQWSEDLLLQQYLRHTGAVEEQIQSLILEAQALLAILQNLEDRIEVIYSIAKRDGIAVKDSRDKLFLDLWTWVGGNRSSMKKHDEQLDLLGQLDVYRKTAWAHVTGTLLKLQSIAADLEDLRDRVAAPDLLAARKDIPLRMHIENIQLGLDRLESQRMKVKGVEAQTQRRVLDRGDQLAQEQALLLT